MDLEQYHFDTEFSPALSEQKRPDYVPEVGWFIELNSKDLSANKIWCDGKVMGRVKRVCITADAEDPTPKAEIVIATPLRARIATNQGTVTEVPLDPHELGICASHCPDCSKLITDVEKLISNKCPHCGKSLPV